MSHFHIKTVNFRVMVVYALVPWVSAIGNTLGEDWRKAPDTSAWQKLHSRALVNVVASRTINFMTTT